MADLVSGDLQDVLVALLVDASADLFGGATPKVATGVSRESLTFGAGPRHDPVGVRRESRTETVAIDPQHLDGPYRLQTAPAPGARVVRVLNGAAVAFTLHDDEVVWAPDDPSEFLLDPRPHRSFVGATGVRVDFGVDSVAAVLLGTGPAVVTLKGEPAQVQRAADLALAVLTLESDQLLTRVTTSRHEGDYTTTRRLTQLAIAGADVALTSETAAVATITLDLAVTIEVRRALREGEGTPILRIATPGAAETSAVAVDPQVDA